MQPHAQQLKGLAWILLALGVGMTMALGLPTIAAKIPWRVEKALAKAQVDPVGVCRDEENPKAAAPFRQILQRLYPIMPGDDKLSISVQVVHNEQINAFAGLAGKIYVYDGLLDEAQSPEELAGVLSHEMEHVKRRHIIQGIIVGLFTIEGLKYIFANGTSFGSELTRLALQMDFTRRQEYEADKGGLERLKRARIDTGGFQRFFERAQKHNVIPAMLSDHPAPRDRAILAKQYSGGPTEPLVTADQWRAIKNFCH